MSLSRHQLLLVVMITLSCLSDMMTRRFPSILYNIDHVCEMLDKSSIDAYGSCAHVRDSKDKEKSFSFTAVISSSQEEVILYSLK